MAFARQLDEEVAADLQRMLLDSYLFPSANQ
jgi:hypothetical protein